MHLWKLLIVALISVAIVEAARSGSSKRRKDKSRSETAVDSSNEDENTSGMRKAKENDEKKERDDREREREYPGGEKKKKDSSSSEEEDDKDDRNAKNETTAKGEKSLLRLRRTQTDAKVEVKVEEQTRARRRRYELIHGRRLVHRKRRGDLTRAQELNDGVQRPLSKDAKTAKENHPTLPPPPSESRHRRQLHSPRMGGHWSKIRRANVEDAPLHRYVRLGYAARHMNKNGWFA